MEHNRSTGEAVNDARLLREIGEMFDHVDPVPDAVMQGARAVFAWRNFDALLAELIDAQSPQSVTVRGHGDVRMLTFHAPGLTVAVESTEVGGTRRLVGQLAPPGPDEVSLEAVHRPGAPTASPVDHLGRFSVSAVPAGLIRLSCALPDGTRVVTEWVET
jgi:hypothetical protein